MTIPGFSHASEMTVDDRVLIRRALRYPRGRYSADRASQLSAVPARTLHDWATSQTLVSDWRHASPRGWSYRDIVYARLLAWLRGKGTVRPVAARRVAVVRQLLAEAEVDPLVRSDGTIFLIGGEHVDRLTGQQAFDGLADLLDVFHLTEPVEGVSDVELWGPSLIRPSAHTYISPWVLRGEPCVNDSRVPSAALYTLSVERGLDPPRIAALYPGLSTDAVEDALKLENQLRRAA